MSETNQREKRHAALYFSPKHSKAYKELAARIRSDGGRTTLIWSNQWKGAESILTECRAIVIEKGCANAENIEEAYRRYAIDVEIHYADSDGEFEEDNAIDPAEDEGATGDDEEHADSDSTSDTTVQEEDIEAGSDTADSDGDGGDGGASDDSAEAGEEESTDSERTSSR